MQRQELIEKFLTGAGWQAAVRAPLAGDASNRRYERLDHAEFGAGVLMDAPPEKGEDVRPFAAITDLLRGAGLSAPRILASDPEHGFLLLEDLGDDLLVRVCARQPSLETSLYEACVDLLANFHTQVSPPENLKPYDLDTYLREVALVTDWYLPGATGHAPEEDTVKTYLNLLKDICNPLAKTRTAIVLRDYHAENLLWLPDRKGDAKIGLLDYQDALAGHPAYDLVSLLEDARRDTSPALQEAMLARYIAASTCEENDFRRAYATLGAQRNLKILGIFARLCRRDGKPAYLAHMPRVWAHLMHDLEHPALADLKAWVLANMPAPDAGIQARIAA